MVKEFNGYAMVNLADELKNIAKNEYNSVSELINEIMEGEKYEKFKIGRQYNNSNKCNEKNNGHISGTISNYIFYKNFTREYY